jgi:acyl dehydratase
MNGNEKFIIGEEATIKKVITKEDIKEFSKITGDTNPVHVNEAYASKSFFGKPIAHGMLTASLISAVLGTKVPGPGAIYMRQSLNFKAPVFPQDEITAKVKVIGWDEVTGRIKLETLAINQDGKIVLHGDAELVMSSYLEKK